MNLLFALFLLGSFPVYAQDFLNFFSKQQTDSSLDLEGFYLPLSDVKGRDDQSQIVNQSVAGSHNVYKNDKSSLAVGAKYQKLGASGQDILLRNYYNIEGNLAFKKELPDDRFWMTSLSFGSSSDRPFTNTKDNTLSATYIQKFSGKWFGAVNYSNNRTFLNHVPLPGFFYIHELNRERAFVIGFPFLFWMRPIHKNWSIRYFGVLPFNHRLKILYTGLKLIRPYLGFEQIPQSFFRSDRTSDNNRVFWFERRAMIGGEGRLGPMFIYDLNAGYAFDREFFESKNFSQNKNHQVDLDNNYFVSLSLKFRF